MAKFIQLRSITCNPHTSDPHPLPRTQLNDHLYRLDELMAGLCLEKVDKSVCEVGPYFFENESVGDRRSVDILAGQYGHLQMIMHSTCKLQAGN